MGYAGVTNEPVTDVQEEEKEKLLQERKDAVLLHHYYQNKEASQDGKMSDFYNEMMDGAETFSATEAELDNYARNTINLGLIQPHGVFVAIDSETEKVLAVSTNAAVFFGDEPQALFGIKASELFQESTKALQAMRAENTSLLNPVGLTVKKTATPVQIILEKKPWCTTMEIEAMAGDMHGNSGLWASHSKVRSIVDGLRSPRNLQSLIDFAVKEIKEFARYDRIMVYRFHDDFHGEVVGEAASEGLETSYMGLHFPATDIPQRARDVFTSCRVRQVVDFQAQAVEIAWPDANPNESILNSNMTLRAVHPCHVEYCEAMGIRASLVLSVMTGQKLWGLFVCHKYDGPHFLPYSKRTAIEFIIQVFSSRVAGFEEAERSREKGLMTQVQTQLVEQMLQRRSSTLMDESSMESMESCCIRALLDEMEGTTLMDLVPGSCGAAVLTGASVLKGGKVPPDDVIRKVAMWGKGGEGKCRSTNQLSNHVPECHDHPDVASGAMVVAVGRDGVMIWFRPEVVETIHWAGDPGKAVQLAKNHRALLPRRSFESFAKRVSQTSVRWTQPQREVAETLAKLVMEVRKSCDAEKMMLMNGQHLRTKAWASSLATELNAMMQSSNVPIFATTLDGTLNFWNEKMVSVTGYSIAHAMGKSLYDMVVKESIGVLREALTSAELLLDSTTLEITIIGNQGQMVHVVLNFTTRKDGSQNPCGAFFVGQDVTEAKKALERCERIEQGYERLLESGVIPAFGVDLDGNVNDWNEGMAGMSKLSKEDVLGKPLLGHVFGKMLSYTDDFGLGLETVINSALLGEETPFYEFSYTSAATGVVDLIVNASPRRDPITKTVLTGIVFVCQNISEREALVMANTIRVAAEAASQAKTEQLGFLCHEIRNPLNGVMGNIAFLEDSELSEEQLQLVHTTQQCCTQLMKIMNDVLDLNKIEEGKLSIELIEYDIANVVRAVMSQIRTTAETKNVTLESVFEGFKHTTVIGDPVRVQQILSNFAWNAIKFTESGSITIKVSAIPANKANTDLALTFVVIDTGAGISAAGQAKLFQPYVQAEGAMTTRQYGGTGLGLSICSKLAMLMGGKVYCTSELGKGSSFFLELDVKAPATPSDNQDFKMKNQQPRWHAGNLSPRRDKSPTNGRRDVFERRTSGSGQSSPVREAGSNGELIQEVTAKLTAYQADSTSQLVQILNQKVGTQWSFRVIRENLQPSHVDVLVEVEAQGCVRQHWGSAPAGPDAIMQATDAGFANACRMLGILHTPRSAAPAPEPSDEAPLESEVDSHNRGNYTDSGEGAKRSEDGEDLSSPKALVVDDEVFNQKIVEVALRKCGFRCELASDGSEAVQLITKEQRRYDVLIMDQMMKKMNGSEASLHIRQYEMEMGLAPMPIICLTANHTPEDKDSYFRSGMNGVLGKPVKVRNLGKSLLTYIEANRASQMQRQLQLSMKSNPGMVVEYRAVEDLVVFQPVPLSDKDKEAYIEKASHIRVVIADEISQVAIQKALESVGVKVTLVNTGEEAIASATEVGPLGKRVDMVLVSQSIPGQFSCKQVSTKIREHEMRNGLDPTRIIALVDKDEERKEVFFASGMDGIISRPVNTSTIAHSVVAYVQEMEKLRAYRFRELSSHKGDLMVEYRRLSDILVFDTQAKRASD